MPHFNIVPTGYFAICHLRIMADQIMSLCRLASETYSLQEVAASLARAPKRVLESNRLLLKYKWKQQLLILANLLSPERHI